MPKDEMVVYEEEENPKKGLRVFLSLLFFFLVVFLLVFYWFFPTGNIEFASPVPVSGNFTTTGLEKVQFYDNMRFPDSIISYRIEGCPPKRSDDMKTAFRIVSGLTSLEFYPVDSNEEIIINCKDEPEVVGGIFVAGEGGPVNITRGGDFNVITRGQILLLKDSQCSSPNIAIHELLHVLGFDHSKNKNNVLYNITNCNQDIGDDVINLIDELYSTESLPDLVFEDLSAFMEGRYLNTNISIRNEGLHEAGDSRLVITADGKLVKEVKVKPIDIGYGRVIILSNVWISQISVDELEYSIETDFSELDKKNNKIKLEIKG